MINISYSIDSWISGSPGDPGEQCLFHLLAQVRGSGVRLSA